MAYSPEQRLERMKELMKPLEAQILLCDDEQDLFALASMLLVTARKILITNTDRKTARQVFTRVLEDI